ncbi:hypothetical protein J437_LFUL015489 [Ladona fulva]|uniref:DUF5641 domain-containing protein n=1 Tax=Ladona fulva TaxID=123851 RepID=A0A8K0KHV0_LADFU|nr:hypothetical protein J437_LFUL015489 [Ladona fulva]
MFRRTRLGSVDRDPHFLRSQSQIGLLGIQPDYQALPELEAHSRTVGTLGVQADPLSWIRRLSSYIKVVRVMAYNFYFGNYYSALRGGGRLPSSLARLRPFVDEDGCIRVGGRLRHSLLASGNKQPWLLPKDVFCRLIGRHYHFVSLHGGPRTVEALISHTFWILSVRVVIKLELTKCVRCCRYRGNVLQPIMADLPASRDTPQRPFAVIEFHLRRIIHGHALNFEEYSTLFCRMEAVLNSPPFVPLSVDPSEINCLTPGHFLIGQQILDLPDADPRSQDSAASFSARWKLFEQIKNNFWRRWLNEYLHTLQQRAKWSPGSTWNAIFSKRAEFACVVLANGSRDVFRIRLGLPG